MVWKGEDGMDAEQADVRERLPLEFRTETNLFMALVLGSGAKLD